MSRAVSLSVIVALALLATPVPSHGQQPGKVYRIGYLSSWIPTTPGGFEMDSHRCPIQGDFRWQAWVAGLREHGYIPGQNIVIECRFTEGRQERAPGFAAELLSLKSDLIVAVSDAANVVAAKQTTSTIPIVLVMVADPVGRGLVAGLAHPGGNVTGLPYAVAALIVGKQFQLLAEAVPKVSRVAVLSFLSSVPSPALQGEYEAAAQALHVKLQRYAVRAPEELADAFAAMTKARAQALSIEPWAFMTANRPRILALATQSRLPAMYNSRAFPEAGGLMSYGPDEPAVYRRLGFYVDKIFHGANPGDLPMEQPTKFELIINLKAAKAIGLKIPQSLLPSVPI